MLIEMNEFKDLLNRRSVPLTLEAPLIRNRQSLGNFIDVFREYSLDRWIIGINTLNNPLGNLSSDPIILGHILQSRLHIEAIPHISAGLENLYTLGRWLLGAALLDINNLLLLTGDLRMEGGLNLRTAMDIVKGFSDGELVIGGKKFRVPRKRFFVGGALLPDRRNEVERAIDKVSLGIKFFQTQVVFDTENVIRVLKEIDAIYRGEDRLHILISLIPMLSERIVNILGSGALKIDIKHLADLSNSEYISHVETIAKNLLEFGGELSSIKLGFHFIPIFWRSEIAANIVEIIERIG